MKWEIQLSLSKGLSKILWNIRTSTYQICRIEEKMHRATEFHKWICYLTPEVRGTLEILWKRGEIAPLEQFLLFSTIFCYLLLEFYVKNRDHILTSRYAVIQDKRVRDNECRLYIRKFWLKKMFSQELCVSKNKQNKRYHKSLCITVNFRMIYLVIIRPWLSL